MEADFSGYATKAGLKCSDGRTIMPEAFKHMDGMTVPLVWQHGHNEPANVLGHAVLEARADGVYAYGFFNDTEPGQNAKRLVQHKDITSLSIYANQLVERAKQVFHGVIREVSLVLSGANPGALIDNVQIAHSDGSDPDILADEAVIYTGLELSHGDGPPAPKADDKDGKDDKSSKTLKDLVDSIVHGSGDEETMQDVYDSLSDKQKELVHFMVGMAVDDGGTDASHTDTGKEGDLTHKEGNETVTRNVFEQGKEGKQPEEHVLTHDAIKGIVEDAQKNGSLKAAVEAYALAHGIDNIDVLFPQARNIDQTPEYLSRRVEWVAGVLNGTRKSPFSRIRSRVADITMEEARAKGYIKGTLKKEEFFSVSARITTPTTVYKKQKLDRDDMIDITDFDVVVWLKAEMRLMLEEEIAGAILIGDGRAVDDEDKIKDPGSSTEGAGIRAIINDHELYVTNVPVDLPASGTSYEPVVEAILRARYYYRGSGQPTFYTTNQIATEMLLSKDGFGRRLWNSKAELTTALNVSDIVEVEILDREPDVVGIMVNLTDYVVGADRGGEINLFDFFDIDYNQYKYLIETRVCGALVKLKSALVVRNTGATSTGGADVVAAPTAPTYDAPSATITIPTDADTDYFADDEPVADADTVVVAPGRAVTITARPVSGDYYPLGTQNSWTFSNNT
jgi:hypothetical protein